MEELAFKVIVVGDSTVGKTSFIQRYVYGRYTENYITTLGADFALKLLQLSNNQIVKLHLWDIAGQERFISMTRVYYKGTHACIIMFDLTQRSSFTNVITWKNDLDSKCTLSDGSPVPCLLIANKCDMPNKQVNQTEIEEVCKKYGFIAWVETSVKEKIMVDESMRFLAEELISNNSDPSVHSEDHALSGIGERVVLREKSVHSTQNSNCSC